MKIKDFRAFSAKILLFGEYLVVQGEEAVALPIKNFEGKLELKDSFDESNIAPFIQYLGALPNIFLKQELIESIDLGKLVFDSNIPIGYGAGSSGALTAAVYDAFVEKHDGSLQNALATMEDFFHGSSSGLDPLVCYLDKPTKPIGKDVLNHFYLLDTGISRKTAPLVQIFNEKAEQMAFYKLAEANRSAIAALAANDLSALRKSLKLISSFQFDHFAEMIPEEYKLVWKETLTNEKVSIKLCGAGGGGFLLIYSEDREYVQQWAKKKKLEIIRMIV